VAQRSGAARRRPRRFDPALHERELRAILDEIAALPEESVAGDGCAPGALDARRLDRIVKRHPKRGRGLFSKSEILAGYRHFAASGTASWEVGESELAARLRLRPVRTLSGVTPVTVLTKPYPCPGRCLFCPSDVRMPKSYLADEPGAQRAEDNRFDPYLQTWNRLLAYREMGHPTGKVELIVLGGTWSFHPERYQRWFVKRCLDAMNDFGAGVDGRAGAGVAPVLEDGGARVDGRVAWASYNRVVRGGLARALAGELLHASEDASWEALEAAQLGNETAGARCVGLTLETRPDCVDEEEVLRLRRLGATKVQVGVQSTSDRVLELNDRGHPVEATRRALRLLRRAGFKIHAHWMANLYGSSPEADLEDFARLFDDPDFRPDELKLYPCSLVESAGLMAVWERGGWRPYEEEALLGLVTECLERVPEYCRVTRVIRDFSAGDIVAGSRTANLREVAERRLAAEGRRCRDIRSREIRGRAFRAQALELRESAYATSAGEERFLQLVAPGDRLVAFLRLTLPTGPAPLPELEGSALIREVHVYGTSLEPGRASSGSEPQHQGLGRRLVEEAAAISRAAGYDSLAVISALGTRPWYRTLGFHDSPLYQHLPQQTSLNQRDVPGR
jgi:elongator complex protein 3